VGGERRRQMTSGRESQDAHPLGIDLELRRAPPDNPDRLLRVL
jgi:hypothetical protein